MQTLKELDQFETEFEQIVRAWAAGQEKQLNDLLLKVSRNTLTSMRSSSVKEIETGSRKSRVIFKAGTRPSSLSAPRIWSGAMASSNC